MRKLFDLISEVRKDGRTNYHQNQINSEAWEKVFRYHEREFYLLFNHPSVYSISFASDAGSVNIYANVTSKTQIAELTSYFKNFEWFTDSSPEQGVNSSGVYFRYNKLDKGLKRLCERLRINYHDLSFCFGYIYLTCYVSKDAECKLVALREEEVISKKVVYSIECAEGAEEVGW